MNESEGLIQVEGILSAFCWAAATAGRLTEAEQIVTRALEGNSEDHPALRLMLQSRLGELWVRSGKWEKAFELLHPISTNSISTSADWNAAAILAALLGRDAEFQSLLLDRLARFAGGADDNTSNLLIGVLLLPQSPWANQPVVRRLTTQALNGSRPWVRIWATAGLAALEYRSGKFEEAFQAIAKFDEDCKKIGQGWLGATFIRCMVEEKLGKHKEARETYARGAESIPPSFLDRSIPLKHEYWIDACASELFRREAAALLKLAP